MKKIETLLARFAPPGIHLNRQLLFLTGAPLLAIFYSLGYFNVYYREYYEIVDYITGHIPASGKMPVFQQLLCLEAFPVFTVSWIAFVITNYLYFFQESKSIYTMRRLRSPLELHLRCWTLPVLGVLILLLCRALCCWLYSLHYFHATPSVLIPSQATLFWR